MAQISQHTMVTYISQHTMVTYIYDLIDCFPGQVTPCLPPVDLHRMAAGFLRHVLHPVLHPWVPTTQTHQNQRIYDGTPGR